MLHTEESSPLKPTRAGFIRTLPVSMPIEEVIERGREIGLAINPSDVHSARYYMRQELARSATKAPAVAAAQEVAVDTAGTVRRNYQLLETLRATGQSAPTNRRAPKPAKREKRRPPVHVSAEAIVHAAKRQKRAAAAEGDTLSIEDTLRRIVMRLGTERARELIEELETVRIR